MNARPIRPVSLRNVPAPVVEARGFRSSLAHDIAQERAARWMASRPFARKDVIA